MIRILSIVLLALFIGVFPNEAIAKERNIDSSSGAGNDFQKTFTGTINKKLAVVFQIESKGGELSGSYFYASKGIDIKLTGTITGNRLEMYELDYLNNKTAKISGELNGSNFNGRWQSLSSDKSLPVSLKESNAKVAPLPSKIEGVYKTQAKDDQTGDESPCELTITITKKEGEYYYNLKSSARDVNGKVSFSRDIESRETYITLEGIKWDEYKGDVSVQKMKKKNKKSRDVMAGIDGLFAENEITIQNDGNAMNAYTKLSECDRKYIRLVKE